MRWQIGWQGMLLAILLFGGGLFLGSFRFSGEPTHSTASERLQPAPAGAATTDGTIVYVPVYSSLYLGMSTRTRTVDLAATVSVRNTSSVHPITIQWVRYYDSTGKQVRDYLDKPAALPPLGSVEFVIQRSGAAGGPGANFLIRWDGPANMDEPLIEAVMFGQSGNAGVSFTSRGQVVKSAPVSSAPASGMKAASYPARRRFAATSTTDGPLVGKIARYRWSATTWTQRAVWPAQV